MAFSTDIAREMICAADAAAQGILDAHNAVDESHWQGDGNDPVYHRLHVPALEGVTYNDINNFTHLVSYGEKVGLRKGHGIIAQIFCAGSVCTGEVTTHEASIDYEL